MRRAHVALLAALAVLPLGCEDETTGSAVAGPEKELIDNAVSAGPESVAGDATVVALAADGTVTTLREGTNGIRCIPDDPSTQSNDPICVDEEGFRWLLSLVRGEAVPANTKPGVAYMLQGGSETKGPFDDTEERVISDPHWAILWPFDPEATGLPTESTGSGAWIMWAGTPYAHLMIDQDLDAAPAEGETPTHADVPPASPLPIPIPAVE
jgi:hypothetical protein